MQRSEIRSTDTAQNRLVRTAEFDAWLEDSMNRASQAFFGKPVMYMGCGGTIPFMKMLGDAYPGVQFFVTGVLGPNVQCAWTQRVSRDRHRQEG